MTAYQRRVRELALERKANERLRLQALVMAKELYELGGYVERRAAATARLILGIPKKSKRAK